MRRVRASVWMVMATLAVSVVLALLPSLRLSSVPTETPARVQTVKVVRGDVRQTVHARGHIRYEHEYAVIAPVTGIAGEIYVEPGDRVTAGQALIRMDDAAQAAAASSAYAAMAAAARVSPEAAAGATGAGSSGMEALTLRASSDGQVLDVLVGQYGGLMAGSGAVLMAGGGQQIVCAVASKDARLLREGMHAVISADGGAVCGAQVRRVGLPVTDSVTGQTVCEVIIVPEEAIDLPYGSAAEAEITLREKLNASTVPLTAVTEDGTVWVVDEGRCWEMDAGVLLADDMRCRIALPEGTVVVDRPDGLIEGQRIREVAP